MIELAQRVAGGFVSGIGEGVAYIALGILTAVALTILRWWPNLHRPILEDAVKRFIPRYMQDSRAEEWIAEVEAEYRHWSQRTRVAVSIWLGAREVGRIDTEAARLVLADLPTDLAVFLPLMRDGDLIGIANAVYAEYLKTHRNYLSVLQLSLDAPMAHDSHYSYDLARLLNRRERVRVLYELLRDSTKHLVG